MAPETGHRISQLFPLAGINNSSLSAGQVGAQGGFWTAGEGGTHTTGKLQPTDAFSIVCGLNSNTLLVGESGGNGFLFDTAAVQIYGLNAYPFIGDLFSQLTISNDINDSGRLVGIGLIDGVQHGFVGQIVVPEPSSFAILSFGFVFLSIFGWMRRKANSDPGERCIIWC